jgi:fluoroacetyl-CoA thioesterase
VGTRLELAHNAPTPVGGCVVCESELVAIDGRKLTFRVAISDDAGEVAVLTHDRFIVAAEKFQEKANARPHA